MNDDELINALISELSQTQNHQKSQNPLKLFDVTDELIKIIEAGKEDELLNRLRNLNATTSYLNEKEIAIIENKLKLLSFYIKYALKPRFMVDEEDILKEEIEQLHTTINLRKNKNGFYADLLFKYHQVVQQKEETPAKKAKSSLFSILFK